MSFDDANNGNVSSLLKQLLAERSLSISELGKISGIDKSTISRIINGKRKANSIHLQKFAECLNIPLDRLFIAAGYPIEPKKEEQYSSDIQSDIDSIQQLLESSKIYNKKFTLESVNQQFNDYKQYALTEEGKSTILNKFEEKLQKVQGIGPFIDQLKYMFFKFKAMEGTPRELAIMGGALLYFILPIDIIPDYIFPIGYLDDAIVVKIALDLLAKDHAKSIKISENNNINNNVLKLET